eukprot:CAMPEP_0172906232 /NCGR_PEP_ID=MMETSP1075-20121228/176403_1 /TAXON_ID=2916 /ORGANISM="Ceratium fusus, Strain PA161109" /LENGTH=69 /DNA_ID=CAMNT_0013763621 /DNA_START=119 /DNA_END=328 /DNA_ORIENTATION=-
MAHRAANVAAASGAALGKAAADTAAATCTNRNILRDPHGFQTAFLQLSQEGINPWPSRIVPAGAAGAHR